MAEYIYKDIIRLDSRDDDLEEWLIIVGAVLLGLIVLLLFIILGMCVWIYRVQKRVKAADSMNFKIKRPKRVETPRDTPTFKIGSQQLPSRSNPNVNPNIYENPAPNSNRNSSSRSNGPKNPLSTRSGLENDNFVFPSTNNNSRLYNDKYY